MNDGRCYLPAIMATVVVVFTAAFLAMIPFRNWARGVVEDWAGANGYTLLDIDDPDYFDRFRHPLTGKFQFVYLVTLRDDLGQPRRCRAVIGHWFLGPALRRIKIQWVK